MHQHTISAIESEEIGMPRGFVRAYIAALARALGRTISITDPG
ncbi:MAG: hypothetical protein AB7G21_04510 [Dehalococcoidia bacterium]